MKSSKSSKNLRFNDQYDSELAYGSKTTSNFGNSYKKDNFITMSLGSNAKLNDIVPNFKA